MTTSAKKNKISVFKKIAVPGTNHFVTIQSKDLNEYVNIFYNKKRYNINTQDIINMKTIPDIIGKIRAYNVI